MPIEPTQEIFDQIPPISPHGEPVANDDAVFLSECRARLGDTSGWKIGNALLTKTDQWGLVWRLDFSDHETAPGNLSRVVCWHEAESNRWFVMFFRNRMMTPLPAP